MPDGYDTLINEEGDNISAGQKQLLTIARAFLADPAILILDEATSSVDTRTEVLIQEAMNALRKERTSFVIAHRLSTIRGADLILVMENGRIVEQGIAQRPPRPRRSVLPALQLAVRGTGHRHRRNGRLGARVARPTRPVTDVTPAVARPGVYRSRMTTSDTPTADPARIDEGYLPPMLNPFAPGYFDDPYAQYKSVREADPVHLSPIGAWALFRYDDVHRVLRDPHLSVEERHAQPDRRRELPPDLAGAARANREERGNHTMLNLDPPDHHRLRRLVSKVFTPRMIEELRPRVSQLVDEHLDAAVARGTGEMDVIGDLAFPLPFIIISEMLGVPDDGDRAQLREWSGAIVKGFDPILTPRRAPRRDGRERRSARDSPTSSSSGSAPTPATICSPA